MSDELKKISTEAENGMKKAINHLEIELSKIRAGKASPSILDGVNVDYYGTPTPIGQIANVQVLDARTISIQPWEKNMLPLIEKAIMEKVEYIVVGTHGRTGFSHVVMGSTAEYIVRHSTMPVMVVPMK